MPEKNPVYVGIEILPAAGRLRRAYAYAALDAERELIATGTGDRAEVLAYLGGQAKAVAALNAPRRPNTGAVNGDAAAQTPLPFPKPARALNLRLCEYQLQQEGFSCFATPAEVKSCPRWVQIGFDLYRHLEGFGYTPFPDPESPRMFLESQAGAVFWRLLGGRLPLPDSLEGRMQRQLVLRDEGLPVADAMDFFLEITRHKLLLGKLPDENILAMEELRALAAAQIAWLAACHPDQLDRVGDAEEGQIALPKRPAPCL